jgi:tetratricopeptide (TPR) repeat protein
MQNQAQKGISLRLQKGLEHIPILADEPSIAKLNKLDEIKVPVVAKEPRIRTREITLGAVLLFSLLFILTLYWTSDRSAVLDRQNQAYSFSLPGADQSMGMGWGCRTPEECKDAISSLTQAIAQKPGSSNAFCKRAWVYDTMGLYKEALQDASQAVRLDKNNADAYEARAYAYAHLDQEEKATLDVNKADSIPTNPH